MPSGAILPLPSGKRSKFKQMQGCKCSKCYLKIYLEIILLVVISLQMYQDDTESTKKYKEPNNFVHPRAQPTIFPSLNKHSPNSKPRHLPEHSSSHQTNHHKSCNQPYFLYTEALDRIMVLISHLTQVVFSPYIALSISTYSWPCPPLPSRRFSLPVCHYLTTKDPQ